MHLLKADSLECLLVQVNAERHCVRTVFTLAFQIKLTQTTRQIPTNDERQTFVHYLSEPT